MFLAAFDFGAADFVRRDLLCIDGFSTCNQRGRPIDDINYICIEGVNFSFPGFNPAAGVHLVTSGLK